MRTDIEKESSTYRVTSQQCSVPKPWEPQSQAPGILFPTVWEQDSQTVGDKGLQQSLAYGDASTSPVRMRLFLTRSEIPGENEGAVKSPYSS